MKAVNLIPADARKSRGGAPRSALRVPTYALLGLLAAALALVTVYVLTGNKIADRTAQLSTLQTQVAQTQAQAARLGNFGKFAAIAQTRVQTVAGIAATRFDWNQALSDLSQVVPANTSLATLSGTVAPGANTGGGSGGLALPPDAQPASTAKPPRTARTVSGVLRLRAITFFSVETKTE